MGTSADGPLSLPEKRKDGKKPGKQLAGVCKGSSRAGTASLGFCAVYFLTDVVPSTPFPGKNRRVGASRNINLPTGREAPSLPSRQKTRTSTFITSLLPLLPS